MGDHIQQTENSQEESPVQNSDIQGKRVPLTAKGNNTQGAAVQPQTENRPFEGVEETDEGDSSWRGNKGSAANHQKTPTGGESDLENAGSGQ